MTRIWGIASYRAGENSQIFGLAERLAEQPGWSYATKRLAYGPLAGPIGLARRISIAGVTEATQRELAPPWPDLVISAGVKNEPVCRWIRRESDGRVRLVFLGRTWASRSCFDLVVTTPQYRLPPAPNVLHNLMTQHGVSAARLAAARDRWRDRFAAYPSPRVGVLVGGGRGPFVLGVNAARGLAAEVRSLGERLGASTLVTTSARTRPEAADEIARALPGAFVHRWRAGRGDNPFFLLPPCS